MDISQSTAFSDHNITETENERRPVSMPVATESSSMLAAWQLQAEQEEDLDLRNVLNVLRRRVWAIAGVAAVVMGITTFKALQREPVYEGDFRVLVEPVNAADDFSDLSTLLSEQGTRQSGLDYETQVQVLRSPELLEPVVKQLQQIYPKISYSKLLRNLNISRLNETKILAVAYSGTDPAEIQSVLDALSQAYLKYSLEERQTNLRQGISFVEEQLPNLSAQVESIQDQLELFRRQHNFITPEAQSAQLSQLATGLTEQRLAVDSELSAAKQDFLNLKGRSGTLASLEDAAVYQQLLSELRAVETKMAEELTRFEPGSLAIRVLEEQRANIIPLLQQEAQRATGAQEAIASNQLKTLAVRSQTLGQAELEATRGLSALPTLIRQYTDLQRELEIATEALARFRTTQETLAIEAAQTEIPWQLIEAPTQPTVPVSPDLQRSLLMGFIASLVLGTGTALLLEKLDNVYHTVDELKAGTKLPLLGTLPYSSGLDKDNRGAIARLTKRAFSRQTDSSDAYSYSASDETSFLEAMRVLHTNIRMLSSDRPIRSILMSSALPGDGKSTASTNLAKVATAMGQRVLVVDVDLRKPQVHARLNLPNDCGLSSLIATDAPLKAAIQPIGTSNQLFVLTAGPIPPDPTKLLASKKMQQLMSTFERCFDLVIYDAPPTTGLADVSLIGRQTDGLVLVTRMGKTDRTILSQTIETLKLAQIPTLGIVANAVRNRAMSGYRYYDYGQSSSIDEILNENPAGLRTDAEDDIDLTAIQAVSQPAASKRNIVF